MAKIMTKTEAVQVLVDHAGGWLSHANSGLCPNELDGRETRDPGCRVCQALVAIFTAKNGNTAVSTLQTEKAKLQQLPQRQDGNIDQLRDLRPIANRLGMYDAADYIRQVVERADQAMQRATN